MQFPWDPSYFRKDFQMLFAVNIGHVVSTACSRSHNKATAMQKKSPLKPLDLEDIGCTE